MCGQTWLDDDWFKATMTATSNQPCIKFWQLSRASWWMNRVPGLSPLTLADFAVYHSSAVRTITRTRWPLPLCAPINHFTLASNASHFYPARYFSFCFAVVISLLASFLTAFCMLHTQYINRFSATDKLDYMFTVHCSAPCGQRMTCSQNTSTKNLSLVDINVHMKQGNFQHFSKDSCSAINFVC